MPINIGERRVDDAMIKNENWYYLGINKGKLVAYSTVTDFAKFLG